MVLYDQQDYNRARRWRLPKRTIMPGEYQVWNKKLDSQMSERLCCGRHIAARGAHL